jgi:hypothetical protein
MTQAVAPASTPSERWISGSAGCTIICMTE